MSGFEKKKKKIMEADKMNFYVSMLSAHVNLNFFNLFQQTIA